MHFATTDLSACLGQMKLWVGKTENPRIPARIEIFGNHTPKPDIGTRMSGFCLIMSRLPAEPRSPAIGTIPVDPSDDAGDGGGNSKGVSSASRATDPNSHTPVGFKLAAVHRTRHLRFQENYCHRTGYVDNSLLRVLAHPHGATTTAYSS